MNDLVVAGQNRTLAVFTGACVPLLLLAFVILTPRLTAAQTDGIAVREYGRYHSAGSDWIILIVPTGTAARQLITVAKNLHSATPGTKYEFFDATDKELAKYLNYNQHDGARGYDYSDNWVSKHNLANLQTMALDAGECANWCLIKEGDVIAKFEQIKCPLDSRSGDSNELESKYDRFTGKTTIRVTVKIKGNATWGVYFSIGTTFVGEKAKSRPEDLMIMITAVSGDTIEAQDKRLLAIVDNAHLDLGELRFISNERLDALRVSTNYAVTVPYLTVMRLAFAYSIEMRFDGMEFKLGPEYQTKLRDMLQQFPS